MIEYYYKTDGYSKQGPIDVSYDELPYIAEACVEHFHQRVNPDWEPGVSREFDVYYDDELYDTITANIKVEPSYEIETHE